MGAVGNPRFRPGQSCCRPVGFLSGRQTGKKRIGRLNFARGFERRGNTGLRALGGREKFEIVYRDRMFVELERRFAGSAKRVGVATVLT